MKKQYYVFACSFFYNLGGCILGFSLIYRLTDRFLFNPGQVGTFIALGQISFFIGCNLYHRFGSLYNPARVFTVSGIVAFAVSFIIVYSRVLGPVYVSYWILSVCSGLFWPPVMAWLTSGLSGKELNREISIFNRSWMSGNLIGPLLAGTLYRVSSVLVFVILNLSYSIVVLLLYLMWRNIGSADMEEKSPPAVQDTAAQSTAGASAEQGAGNTPGGNTPGVATPTQKAMEERLDFFRYRGWISGFSSSMCLGVLTNIIPLHIRDGLGFTEQSAGVMLFMRCLSGLAGFTILARFTTWHFNRRWFFSIQAGLILVSALFLTAGSRLYYFYFVVLLYGFLNSACYNNSIFHSGATGRNPKKNLAMHEIFMSMGSILGTAGGGFIYQHFRFTGTYLALILFLGLGMGSLVYLDRRPFRRKSGQ